MREIILDIIGGIFLLASIIFFYLDKITFIQGTALGVAGLALFVFKESAIRKLVEKFINKYLDK